MSKNEYLTHSTVFQDTAEIEIPKEVIKELSEVATKGQVLSIYASNARAIYFFPVISEVYRINIAIYPLTPEIVAKIMTKISEFASKVIYSTGLCLVENKCFWEGFFASKDLVKPIDDIKETLSSIPEVNEILIEKVETK